jgi:ribosomal protein L25 (general stress protein Ctc)
VASSDISPFLGKAFGGGTGLVDVEVGHRFPDLALRPQKDPTASLLDVAVAANELTVFPHDRKHHALAEIEDLLDFVVMVLLRGPPALDELSNRGHSLEAAYASARHIPHRLGSVEAHQSIKVLASRGHVKLARSLRQVGVVDSSDIVWGVSRSQHGPVCAPTFAPRAGFAVISP